MIKGIIAPGYNISDNCHKYTNDDSTIECYVYTREALLKPIKTTDKELNTNSVYALVGTQDDEIKVYVGQGCKARRPLHRVRKHLDSDAERNESYYPYWNIALVFVCRNEEEGLKWGTDTLDDLEALLIRDTQNRYSWNSKAERVKNPLTPEKIRSYARKLLDIKEYVKYLGFNFFDKEEQPKDDVNVTYDEQLDAEEKQLIDTTVELTTINLEPNATIPEYTTPEAVVKEMIEKLPWDEFDETTKFFDPACKDGGFLRAIYDRLISDKKLIAKYNGNADALKNKILSNLYGIALNQNSKAVTVKNLNGFGYNTTVIPDYVQKIRYESLEKLTKEAFGEKNMKFDVVIGNPPYNDDDTKVATAIYSRFVEDGMKMADKCSAFITPARWYASGRGLDHFRKLMLTQHKIKKLVDYEDEKQIFPNQTIAGGVCYFLADKEDNKLCEITSVKRDKSSTTTSRELDKLTIFVRDTKALEIIDKIMDEKFYALSVGVQSVDYFNVKDNPYVCDDKKDDSMVPIVDAYGFLYANREDLNDEHNLIDKYNVIVTHAIGSKDYVLPKTMRILPIGQACSVTYLCIGATNNKDNAENLLKYIKTRFVRFLIKQAISGINISSKSFMFVPLQDFTSSSDIDWSQSIADIDKKLYEKYNLTDDEISYIESTIKPMDTEPSKPTNTEPSKQKYTPQDLEANYINRQLQQQSK